jgi:hypothetical protein
MSANRRTRYGRRPGRTCAGDPESHAEPSLRERLRRPWTPPTPRPSRPLSRKSPGWPAPFARAPMVPLGTSAVQIPPDTARHLTAPTSTERHVTAPTRKFALVGHNSSTTAEERPRRAGRSTGWGRAIPTTSRRATTRPPAGRAWRSRRRLRRGLPTSVRAVGLRLGRRDGTGKAGRGSRRPRCDQICDQDTAGTRGTGRSG